jgi:hypothetical protein
MRRRRRQSSPGDRDPTLKDPSSTTHSGACDAAIVRSVVTTNTAVVVAEHQDENEAREAIQAGILFHIF